MLTENTHHGAERVKKIMNGAQSVFFIGIGGINMSSLAHLTHIGGKKVSGSDRTESAVTKRLEAEGIKVFYRHAAENTEGCDVIVYTVAIPDDNPEYSAAREKGIPTVSRADYLGYIMTEYVRRMGIAGTHGKSTTTSMTAEIFMRGGGDPTVLSGAELCSMGGAYRIGKRENFIFEACEYRDSFLDFNPTVAAVLNIEEDHLDYFGGLDAIKRSFKNYISLPSVECAIVNADDKNCLDIIEDYSKRAVTFAISADADYRAEDIRQSERGYCFDIVKRGERLCSVALSVPGKHNIYNALAAAAIADGAGISPDAISEALSAFGGASRRMEYKGRFMGAAVYDDYAHHPTEIRASVDGARSLCDGKLTVVFQSHTRNRTEALFDGFVEALGGADKVIVADIYDARTDSSSVSASDLAEALGEKGEYVGGNAAIAARLRQTVSPDDVLVIMGAGDIGKLFAHLGELEK